MRESHITAAKITLSPLLRAGGLKALRLIAAAGRSGISRRELEAALVPDERCELNRVLNDLLRAGAAAATPERQDARRHRYHPTLHTPRLLAVGDSLLAWARGSPLAVEGSLSPEATKRTMRLVFTLWAEGIVEVLQDHSITVDDLARSLGSTRDRVRYIVDRATERGLLEKRQGPGGLKLLSTTALFGRLVPTAARVTLYTSRALGSTFDCLTRDDLSAALIELVRAAAPARPIEAAILLRVYDVDGEEVNVIAVFRQGRLVDTYPSGDASAKIESDRTGWLALLADLDRSELNWSGRGARALLEAFEDLARI